MYCIKNRLDYLVQISGKQINGIGFHQQTIYQKNQKPEKLSHIMLLVNGKYNNKREMMVNQYGYESLQHNFC